MNLAVPLEPRPWSRRRRFALVLGILALQLGCIWWLSDRTPLRPRIAERPMVVRLADPLSAKWLELTDPTLLALPHQRGVAGLAWLRTAPCPLPQLDYTNPPFLLPLTITQPGGDFHRFVQTNANLVFDLPNSPPIGYTVPAPSPFPPWREHSSYRIAGELRARKLLTPFTLQAYSYPGCLSNTVVRVAVDGRGQPWPMLLQRSGWPERDQEALALVRAARFAPLAGTRWDNPGAQLTRGVIIFQWANQQSSPTNTAPQAPNRLAP